MTQNKSDSKEETGSIMCMVRFHPMKKMKMKIPHTYGSRPSHHIKKVPKILVCDSCVLVRLVAGGRQHIEPPHLRVHQALLCILSREIREEEKEWRKPLLLRCSFAISFCLRSSSLSCLCALAIRSQDLFKDLMRMERGRTYPQHPH